MRWTPDASAPGTGEESDAVSVSTTFVENQPLVGVSEGATVVTGAVLSTRTALVLAGSSTLPDRSTAQKTSWLASSRLMVSSTWSPGVTTVGEPFSVYWISCTPLPVSVARSVTCTSVGCQVLPLPAGDRVIVLVGAVRSELASLSGLS